MSDTRTPREIHDDDQLAEHMREYFAAGGRLQMMTLAQQRAYLAVRALGTNGARTLEPDGPCDACGEPAEGSMVLDAPGACLRVWLCRACADVPILPEPENAA